MIFVKFLLLESVADVSFPYVTYLRVFYDGDFDFVLYKNWQHEKKGQVINKKRDRPADLL